MPYNNDQQPSEQNTRTSREIDFTNQFLMNLKPSGKRVNYSDGRCQGLVLRLGISGTKSWAFIGRDCNGKNGTKTIGRYPDISLKEARAKADAIRASLASPESLAASKKAASEASEVTLLELILEAEKKFSETKKIWQPRGKKSDTSTARQVIGTVFGEMFDRRASELTAEKAAILIESYEPKRAEQTGKPTANGQAARALSYLRTVFNWASHRTPRFQKLNAGRMQKINLDDLSRVHDPSIDDPTLEKERKRVLSVPELKKVLPHLVVDTSEASDWLDVDMRPIAHRFILHTLARRHEVEQARKKDFDFEARTWTRRVKGGATITHPMSQAVMNLVLSLPGFDQKSPDDFVFHNREGGVLGNWDRCKDKLVEASGVDDWHRHDLRRTSATILRSFGVPSEIVDTLLSHVNPMAQESTSSAVQSYVDLANEIEGFPNLLRAAVEKLSDIIARIEDGRDLAGG